MMIIIIVIIIVIGGTADTEAAVQHRRASRNGFKM